MLVLTRKADQEIVIGNNIGVKVLEVHGNKVRLGVFAPKEIGVHRAEVEEAVDWKLITSFCESPEHDGQGCPNCV